MRIAVLDESDGVTNVIVSEESELPSLGVALYEMLTDEDVAEIGLVLEKKVKEKKK